VLVVAVRVVAAVFDAEETVGAEECVVWGPGGVTGRLVSGLPGPMVIVVIGVQAITSSAMSAVWDFSAVLPPGVCAVFAVGFDLAAEPPVLLGFPGPLLFLVGLFVAPLEVSITPVSR
jgi:hypothetical protein